MFSPLQSPHSPTTPQGTNFLQNREIDEQIAYLTWDGALNHTATVVLGDPDRPIVATAPNVVRALLNLLRIDQVNELDIRGVRFTDETAELFFQRINFTAVKKFKMTFSNIEQLVQFSTETVTFQKGLTSLSLSIENSDGERDRMCEALNTVVKNASRLASLELDKWSLNNEELKSIFQHTPLCYLTTLSLCHNCLTEEVLDHLADAKDFFLQEATCLKFSNNQIRSIPQDFIVYAAKPGLILDLKYNEIDQEEMENFFADLPQRKKPLDMSVEIFPQRVALHSSLETRLKLILSSAPPESPQKANLYGALIREHFGLFHTFCRFENNITFLLKPEMIRALVYHHGKTAEESLKELFDVTHVAPATLSLPAPFLPPVLEDSVADLIADEKVTPANASLRWWHMLKHQVVLECTTPFTSVGAARGLVELLSHPDSPIKELLFEEEISEPCWEVLAEHFPRMPTLSAISYEEISPQRLQQLKHLPQLEYLNVGGKPARGFLDALLSIGPLKYLDIEGRMIKDAGLQKLLECIQPEYLLLNKNGITDDGFEMICECYEKRTLRELQLESNPITSPLPLLLIHHMQPLIVAMGNVSMRAQEVISYYEELSKLRKEGYIALVKHQFCYPLYTIDSLVTIYIQQLMLHIEGRAVALPLIPETKRIKPYLKTIKTLTTNNPGEEDILFLNGHPHSNYLTASFLARHYSVEEGELLDLLAVVRGEERETLEARVASFAPKTPLEAMKIIDPYPVFVYDKNTQFQYDGDHFYPFGELPLCHYAIKLYRTQEGRYYLLKE